MLWRARCRETGLPCPAAKVQALLAPGEGGAIFRVWGWYLEACRASAGPDLWGPAEEFPEGSSDSRSAARTQQAAAEQVSGEPPWAGTQDS